MTSGCAQPNCTVAETGTCLLNNELSTCPQRIAAQEAEATSGAETEGAHFPTSRAYTLDDAKALMAERYVHVVGVLGESDAGKTGCLVSLYLAVAQRQLDGFGFADSRTLMGFEEVSQGARRWNEGRMPEQLTDHTVLDDERTAGFLHMRLRRSDGSGVLDLLCSDLPGEWTRDLIEANRVDRLAFLRRADVIWLVVDGRETVDPERRQVCFNRVSTLIGRLADFLDDPGRLILVVTRRDLTAPDSTMVDRMCAAGTRCGFETECVEVASFADEGAEVKAGVGIARLIELTTVPATGARMVWERTGEPAGFKLPKVGLLRGAPDES